MGAQKGGGRLVGGAAAELPSVISELGSSQGTTWSAARERIARSSQGVLAFFVPGRSPDGRPVKIRGLIHGTLPGGVPVAPNVLAV